MQRTPSRPCRFPGCTNICDIGVYCREHQRYSTDRVRGGADARGYNAEWRRAMSAYLQRHPLCAECMREGKLTPATVVDHIIPHRGNKRLFWDENNWHPLCKPCHSRKNGSGY